MNNINLNHAQLVAINRDIFNPAITYHDLSIGDFDTVRISKEGAKYRAVWGEVDYNHKSRIMAADNLSDVILLATTRINDCYKI